MSYSWLPRVLAEIADVVGFDAALEIARRRGGGRATFPSRASALTDDHWLVEAIGHDDAARLCAHFTSGHTSAEVEIPLGPTGALAENRAALRRMLNEGLSGEEIARRLRISSRTVRRHRRPAAEDGRQEQLF